MKASAGWVAMVLVAVVGVGSALAQGSDFRQRVEQQQREVQQRIEETRQQIERDRQDMQRRNEAMERESRDRRDREMRESQDRRDREMRESQARRDQEARDRQNAAGAAQGSSYGSSSYAPSSGGGYSSSFPQSSGFRPGGPPAQSGVIPAGGVQVTSVQVQPVSSDSGPTSGIFDGLGEGLLRFAAGAVVLGGIAFILAGFVLGRELKPNESQVVIAVTLMLSSLVTLSTAKLPSLKVGATGSAAAFKRLDVPEGKFAIDMPEPRARTTGTAMGLGITQFSHTERQGGYSIGWFDIPAWMQRPGQESFSMDSGCTGAVQNMGNGMGTPTETRRTTVMLPGGHPGREVEGVLPRKVGKFRFRAYMVGNRFYFISVTGEDAWVTSPATKRFLDSFALVPAR